ncbi:RagB/SusD family nutrient uptake outer membrane protein [Aureibaculum sp. A20]|uniref:RagB/SusD family nutrient uptake outer membrane protein n=1 Tax=Aureibaculum flavum TaxID=2795986 RepID=A0ABS0WU65_9FLAO|nr:RagB/SusD family nutrient uptake outer membrane protein [Aureibaculum flavum]MBJ2175534.1 RagB/SusD family nutrient uptake outer membrane protein [Aureibaculum flavum]
MKNYKIVLVAAIICLFTACDDFLEVTPRGEVIPETVEDYELLLNTGRMHSIGDNNLLYMTDNVYLNLGIEDETPIVNSYFWKTDLDTDISDTPQVWYLMYGSIYYANSIINNIQDATEGSQQQKDEILGEALTVKSMAEFHLLTVFANTYDPITNPSDLGIPLMSSTSVTEEIPPRATLKDSFEHIISNLEKAILLLPEIQATRYRVTKFGAQGLLARIYLYLGNFEQANAYATLALESSQIDKVLDYNMFLEGTEFPKEEQNNEKIWLSTYGLSSTPAYSKTLLDLYGENDIRVPLFTLTQTSGLKTRNDNRENTGISYPEMLMIQAEYEARLGDFTIAMELVNNLRLKRLPDDAPDLILIAESKEEALTHVMQERRRELAYTLTRWMDMKRLGLLGEMPDVSRYPDNDPNEAPIETLAKGSTHYTFEIPLKVRILNPSIKLNH